MAKKRDSAGKPKAADQTVGGAIVVKMEELGVPSETFDADYAWAQWRNGSISICFAKARFADPRSLTERFEVRVALETLQMILGSMAKLRTGIEAWIQDHPLPRWEISTEDLALLEVVEEYSLWASVVRISHVGSEAQVDLHQFTLHEVAQAFKAKNRTHFGVTPLLRISTTTFELHRILLDCQRIADEVIRKGER